MISASVMKGLNKLYSSMLTRVEIVTIVASEIHILVVKVIYLDKFLQEHSSAAGIVKE